MKKLAVLALAGAMLLPGVALAADNLDALYGIANRPSYIKHYEADKQGNVLLNPYLQVGSKEHPGVLDPSRPIYNYVVTQEGNVALIEEAPHPYGRTYPKGFFRPEDKSKRKPGTTENYGHVSATAGGPGRISGEVINDTKNKCWQVNNKSGRYSKRNPDRTPEQFANAVALIKEVFDPGTQPWCAQGVYLLAYAPDALAKELRNSPDLVYEEPETKKNAYVPIVPGGKIPKYAIPPYEHISLDGVSAGAPAAKEEKKAEKKEEKKDAKGGNAKAAYNDDPS